MYGFLSDKPTQRIFIEFKVHASVHRKYIFIYIQQEATLHSLFISGNCSTCFGWYLHPSSGAHTTVSTASGTCQTVMDTNKLLIKCMWVSLDTHIHFISNLFVSITVWQVPDVVDTVVCAPDDGWRYHPKHVEQFPEINKLCNVVSCWVYIRIPFLAFQMLPYSCSFLSLWWYIM